MMFRLFQTAVPLPQSRHLAVLAVLAMAAACSGAPRAEGPVAGPGAGDPAVEGEGSPFGDFLAARHAERINDAVRAAELFERTLRHSPDNPALMRQTMHQMLAAGRVDDAAAVARRYIRHEPKSVIAGLTLAVADMAGRRTGAAAERLAKVPTTGLGGYFVPLTLAWARFAEGDTQAALKALAPLAAMRGGQPFHDYHAALILDLAGDTVRAGEFFEKLSANGFSGYSRFVELAGGYWERNGAADKAREIYAAYLKSRPDARVIETALARVAVAGKAARDVNDAYDGAAEGLFNLATLLSQENVPEIGMMVLQMALRLRPGFDAAQLLRGDILASTARGLDAIAAYDKVSTSSPLSWSARLHAAQLLDQAGKTNVAIARLRDMGREEPKRADALIALGDLLRFKKRYPESVEAYDAAVARIGPLNERHWALLYSRAISLERAKHWDRAERDFLKALEFQPNQPFVLNYLGYSWVEKRRHLDRALDMIEKAVRLRPNDGFIVDSLGWAHYQLKSFTRAVISLERAVELSPHDPTINDHLGDAYWRVGRQYEARFQWSRALSLEPEPDEVSAIEKKLSDGLPAVGTKSQASDSKQERSGG